MRKILISVLLVLLLILAYFVIFQGISIGTFNILGTKEIIELNDTLTAKIDETNEKIKNQLESKNSELSDNVDILLKNKEEYYKLANVSTESEISKANTEEIYNVEYLWLKVGRYARKKGVIVKMDIKTGTAGDSTIKDLSFTVTGNYIPTMDFISSLEEDSDLNFRIDNFKMVPSGEILQTTFDVKGIKIKLENTTQDVATSNLSDNSADNNAIQ